MYNGRPWVPNINVWTPRNITNSVMYSVFDENGEGLGKVYTAEELENKLSGGDFVKLRNGKVRSNKDGKVSFAPLSTIIGGISRKGHIGTR